MEKMSQEHMLEPKQHQSHNLNLSSLEPYHFP